MKSLISVVILAFAVSGALAGHSSDPETYYIKADHFDKVSAVEAVSRVLAALDKLKRIGACGDNTLVQTGVKELNATLSSDFQFYNLSTTGGASPFVFQVDRPGYLTFMQSIATGGAYLGSQHAIVDPIVSFSNDGKVAYITGRYIEFGNFRNGNGIPTPEESQSDMSAVVVLEDISNVAHWPSFIPVIQKAAPLVVPQSAFRVRYLYEQGNMRKSNGIVRDYQRNMCPGIPDATNGI